MEFTNQKWVVAQHAQGHLHPDNYQWQEEILPEPQKGQVLIRSIYLSLDPTNRVWMGEEDTYLPALKIGEVMRGLALGRVESSQHPSFQAGDLVSGLIGWQKYLITDGVGLSKLPLLAGFPLTAHFGLLGHIGLTAHYGMIAIGNPQPGETVVVSAAAGAVGSLAGQIARIKGCQVIGIAGTDEKCEWLKKELNFTETINYRKESLQTSLAEYCPNGIDLYFDNVGGQTLDTVLHQMNNFGRVVVSGMISQYNADGSKHIFEHLLDIVTKRLMVKGFVCLDHMYYAETAFTDLLGWWQEGKIRYRIEVIEGLASTPSALLKLFNGSNTGKLLIRVSDE
jgi:NADPH-dependent curcumin reductase